MVSRRPRSADPFGAYRGLRFLSPDIALDQCGPLPKWARISRARGSGMLPAPSRKMAANVRPRGGLGLVATIAAEGLGSHEQQAASAEDEMDGGVSPSEGSRTSHSAKASGAGDRSQNATTTQRGRTRQVAERGSSTTHAAATEYGGADPGDGLRDPRNIHLRPAVPAAGRTLRHRRHCRRHRGPQPGQGHHLADGGRADGGRLHPIADGAVGCAGDLRRIRVRLTDPRQKQDGHEFRLGMSRPTWAA